MKKHQLDHILRAAGDITGRKQFVIVGSEALHGKYPDLADEIVMSAEADLFASRQPDVTELLNEYVAARDKDRIFTRELARCGLVDRQKLLALVEQAPISTGIKERIRADIASDFASSDKKWCRGAESRRERSNGSERS
ncbi:hypothetical protein [Enhydrobacter sp.]|jgi:hypothetical protein|uniref:hypothetical protein n=1 Tax=Enhydrobacter sp. TaxID=1894999 RepID=UPI0026122150|nr:hypothetical protein [Enhydrobacter sp.]WIM09553.1 MAG: hypothetical protein OJF58_000506 [Enhydrobacter sp.]